MSILALVLAGGAAVATIPAEGVVHIRRELTRAHGCAVRADILLTARHVVEDARDGRLWQDAVWADLAGNEGRAITLGSDAARDVVMLQITSGVPGRTYTIAAAAPKPGDRVRLVGYDDNHPFRPRFVETEVIGVDAGHVFYRKSPGAGSSGSCVLNAADEVVAINHAMKVNDGSVQWGQGVSVYGIWAPELPAKEER